MVVFEDRAEMDSVIKYLMDKFLDQTPGWLQIRAPNEPSAKFSLGN